jgi:adenylate kinase family enzyme
MILSLNSLIAARYVGHAATPHGARQLRTRSTRDDHEVQRVSVVGNSGSGKTSLGRRIASAIDAPFVELDAIHHLANWQPIDPQRFLDVVGELTKGERWVVDGNYRSIVVEGPVWQRADTVVWLDLPRRTVMRQIVRRTARRTLRREVLWNGNREPLRNWLRWNPEASIIRWAWTNHDKYRQRYEPAMDDPVCAHLRFVRLTSRRAAEAWVSGLR